MMTATSATSKCLNVLCLPWNYKPNTGRKLASWAAFVIVGWICCSAARRVYQGLKARGKIYSIGKRVLFRDPISQALAGFDNSRVKGQIYGIYMTTNELNLPATNQFFREHPRPGTRTIHIGCATWHNLDIMCTRRSNYGLIVDFNPKNAEFIRKTIDIINSCDSRNDFKQAMVNYLNSLVSAEKKIFFHPDQRGLPTDRIEMELSREGSWLQSEENYLFIKELVANGRLIAITENMTNFDTFSRIRKFLDSNNITIDTLYLSNICNFITTASDRISFVKSVKLLLDLDTIFINCPKLRKSNTSDVLILHQKTVLGREILARSYDTTKIFEVSVEIL